MSTIVSAPVPVPYCHSPYRKPTLVGQIPGGESNILSSTKGQYPKQADFCATSPSKSHRWSPNSTLGECTAEEKQMTNNGTVPGPPPAEGYHWQRSNSAAQSHSDHASLNSQTNGRLLKMEDQSGHGSALPPLHRTIEGHSRDSERRTSRSLGVHSILNPTHGEEPESRPRRRSFAQMEEDFRTNPSIANAMLGRPQSGEYGQEENSPPLGAGGQRMPRRILTPISPRIQNHRTTGYGQGRMPTGTIDAQETPFLSPSARFHHQEASPAPQPPAVPSYSNQPQQQHSHSGHVSQQNSPFLVPAAPAPTPPLGGPSRRPSVSVVHSARASPSPSNYSSYSQGGMSQGGMSGMSAMSRKTSPSPHNYQTGSGPTPPGSYQLSPSPVSGPLSSVPPVSLEGEQQQGYNAMVSSGQNYQLLTIDTTKGHMQLPVEVQAASRMADEKRKRNAGASARFRQRRKEKEREASSRISNLEQELAWAQEDSRFYKQERDHLSDLVLRNFPQYKSYIDERPASPIRTRDLTRRRLSTHDLSSTGDSASPRAMPGPPPIMPTDRYDQTEGERPATRRRTETFPMPSPAVTTPGHRSYHPASPSFPHLGRSAGHLPTPQPQQYQPAQVHQDQQHQQSRQQMPPGQYAPPTAEPPAQSPQLPPIGHAPFRQDQSHEQRSWAPRPEHPR